MRHFTSVIVLTVVFLQPLFAQELSDSKDLSTWHLPRGATLRMGKGRIGGSDRAVAFSPDGKLLAVASGTGVWLYTVENLEAVALLPSGRVNSISFSSDGATLASGGNLGGKCRREALGRRNGIQYDNLYIPESGDGLFGAISRRQILHFPLG